MRKSPELEKLTGLASRFGVFVAERHPLALADALEALEAVTRGRMPSDEHGIDALRPALREELGRRLQARAAPAAGLGDTTPRTTAEARLDQAHVEVRRCLRRLPASRGHRGVAERTSGAKSCAAWCSPERRTTG